MLSRFRWPLSGLLCVLACVSLNAQDRYAVDWQAAWNGGNAQVLPVADFGKTEVSAAPDGMAWTSDGMVWYDALAGERRKPKQPVIDTVSRPKNKLTAKEWRKTLTFAERNSGAFRSKKHGGVRSPGLAALCSAVVPGLGQCYNAQWYKPPVIYAGAAVIAYFVDFNFREKRIYEREIDKRYYNADESIRNPDLAGKDQAELLRLRNYYEQNFELTLIIAGAVYLLNIIDAVVYAYLFDFNVSSNLSFHLEPYVAPNFTPAYVQGGRVAPVDMGFRLCMDF